MTVQMPSTRTGASAERWRARYGPWAIVTGASDGIGQEIARGLAERGLNLVLVARRRSALETLAAELSQRWAVQVDVIDADLSQTSGVDKVLAATSARDVGLMVASAGFGTSGALIEADLATELNMLDVNCRTVLAMAHHYGQRFAAQRRGGLILLSSVLAFQGVPMAANYAATKAYVQSLAEGLSHELAPFGVDVLASAPGPTRSGFAERASMQLNLTMSSAEVARATLNALGHKTTVRPGWLSLLIEGALTGLPRFGRVRVMGALMKAAAQGARS